MMIYRKTTIYTRTDSQFTKTYSESEPRRSTGTALRLAALFSSELRVAFLLNLLDLGNEELPGGLGPREVQGGLAQADQDVVVLGGSLAVDAILPDLQKMYQRQQTDNTEETYTRCLIQRFQLV